MKKVILLAVILLVTLMVVVGCAQPAAPTTTVTAPAATVTAPAATVTAPAATVTAPAATVTAPAATVTAPAVKEKYVWVTPPPGGTIYITTGALALVADEVGGMKSYVETVINCDVVQMNVNLGKADFGQSGSPRIEAGYQGTFAGFKGEATKNIRVVLVGPATKTPWFSMKAQSNITSFEEMKGKILLGGVTQMYTDYAEASLKYHGVFEDIKELRMGVGSPDLIRSLIEGRVDAVFGWSGTAMYEYDAAGGYNIIEETPEEIKALSDEYGLSGWFGTTLFKGEFDAPRDYQVAAMAVPLLTNIDVPNDVVYTLLESIFASQERLAKIHEKAGMFNKEGALIALAAPIHPGAKQYYQDAGMWTDALEARNQQLLDKWGFKE